MPNPQRSDVHVNVPLTRLSVAFMQAAENFVAGRVFPNIPVAKQSDKFFTYDRGYFNRSEMKKRAPATESAGGGYGISTDSYSADVYAFHKDIADQIRNNADAPLNLDREAMQFITLQALLLRETLWATNFFTAGDPGDTWTFDTDGASSATAAGSFDPTDAANNQLLYWSSSSSTPLADVAQGKKYVLQNTGIEPNKLVVGYEVWEKLKNNSDIVDRIKYSGGVGPARPARVTTEAVAALFELDEILVMKSVQNTADEGQANSHSFIGGKNALLCYAPPAAGLMTPSAGYTFSWTGQVGAGPEGNRIKRFRMEHLDSDRIEIEAAFDQKLVSADLGYFFGGIVQ